MASIHTLQDVIKEKIKENFKMEHHGKKLKQIAKEQGFDIQRLADALEMHRVTVEGDFKAEKLTRRILKKYVSILDIDMDLFFKGEPQAVAPSDASKVEKLQAEIIYWQRKYIDLQERFFPNAAQLV
ncbi:hypothetical protein [Spirosoma sp.]|uniref:hypothetical protein n=1 Tax=Spirosoma sp. TaxID=1899569 RepID=UPI001AD1B447|nr:hypothetical protein [Spirosoma sp.]MBN8823898.1 hypothetical protein [Spirosoma sp.]